MAVIGVAWDKAIKAGLTKRDLQVLQLLAEGAETKEIAAQCRVSDSTIRSQLNSMRTKLAASNRVQLVVRALEWGILVEAAEERDNA